MIYFDNGATTSVHKQVLEEMLPYFDKEYGNPESKYYALAENAKKAIELSRLRIASFLKCNSNEVIFNSGATEGNNTILKGICDYYSYIGNHIITTAVEHSSIYSTCKYLEKKGLKVTYLPVNRNCQINIDDLISSITDKTILISIMWVNNEVGSVFPINEVSKICRERGILFHTDATQAIGKFRIDLNKIEGLSFLTFSGHKINGPKGTGVLISKKDENGFSIPFTPLLHGGEHEDGTRAGTLNVPGIVGIGKACEILNNQLEDNLISLRKLDISIRNILKSKFGDLIEFNNDFERVHGIINIRFKGINNQILLKHLSPIMAASTGSACSNLNPSKVLLAMGLNESEVTESIRITISPYMSEDNLLDLYKI